MILSLIHISNGDRKPDTNIDIDGDGKPDINIDTNGNGKPDMNIDTNGDGKPDINIDIDGDGKPDIKDVYKRQEGYYVSTVGINDATVAKYIREQEAYDIAMDKLSVKEYKDPFEEKEIKKENIKKKKGKKE